MTNVDKIQSAEAKVAEMQDALGAVQIGLERAEAVAVAAEEAKQQSEQLMKIAAGLLAVTVVLIGLSRRLARSR